MKIGRNEACPCGSGKKYKHCCIQGAAKQSSEMFDGVEQLVAANPGLSMEELNSMIEQQMNKQNHQPQPDFCGLSSDLMHNWLHSPWDELERISIRTPTDLSSSPVMRYLELILEEALQNEGSIRATSKGNLPAKLVKQASDLLPEFAVAPYESEPSISEFQGSNEDKFNALHYTRILAEIAGLLYRRKAQHRVKLDALRQYKAQGVQAFFKPMLEAALTQYNWGYMDAWEFNLDLRTFWIFLLWRLQTHSSLAQLVDEMVTAFPMTLNEVSTGRYSPPKEQLEALIRARFVDRFLQFWGFVIMDPRRFMNGEPIEPKIQIQPLLKETFRFSV